VKHFIFYLPILLISFCFSSCTTHLYFVRHAEKRNSADTTTLTLLGQERAKALSELLIHSSIDSIYCTKYNRTQQTAQPLSHAIHKPIIIYNLDSLSEFSQKLVNKKGKNILVVGHSNTVPKMIQHLTGERVEIQDNDFDNLFIVSIYRFLKTEIKLSQKTYGAPTP
jgi:2,3-bisphosphoglycerate-dependent phosphoglycerate mutase